MFLGRPVTPHDLPGVVVNPVHLAEVCAFRGLEMPGRFGGGCNMENGETWRLQI